MKNKFRMKFSTTRIPHYNLFINRQRLGINSQGRPPEEAGRGIRPSFLIDTQQVL